MMPFALDENLGLRPSHNTVVSQQGRPVRPRSLESRVFLTKDVRHNALRRLDPIVSLLDLDWKHGLHRRPMRGCLAVDSLEGKIASDHDEAATIPDVFRKHLQAVGKLN